MAMKNGEHHLPCLDRVERKQRRNFARVWDKTQLLCQLPPSARRRDSRFFNCPVLFKKTWFLIPTATINHSVVLFFIVSEMCLLSPYNALLD